MNKPQPTLPQPYRPVKNWRVIYWTLSDGTNSVVIPAPTAEEAVETVKAGDQYLFAQLKSVELQR